MMLLRWPVLLIILVSQCLSGCAVPREPSRTPRTAIEQLLLSRAISRSVQYVSLPLPVGKEVVIDTAGFPQDRSLLQTAFPTVSGSESSDSQPIVRHNASDLPVMLGKIEAKLGELGYKLHARREDADYFIRVIVEALGTEQGLSFFGMPPVQSVLIPFALPELTVFKAQLQRAYARFTMDCYDAKTGELVRSVAWHEGLAYYNQYTVLFFFTFHTSDLSARP
ncbi:hypothetical protein YTPLAS18_28290 [Nitrospira sp.]|nr:hypothetical protein YTPLAS18_28290 [Nitrospira sp.]